jgi:carboxylesterase type B
MARVRPSSLSIPVLFHLHMHSIRFAAPPIEELRWQRPEAPAVNRSATIEAGKYGPRCYQIGASPSTSSGDSSDVSEDCLFLNVQSPANATSLPVLVWIHGGGYGAGNGRQDFTDLLKTNGNNFVAVSIQYRLGPFGFLASDEVFRQGVANAGLLDQFFALQWVQVCGKDSRSRTVSADCSRHTSASLAETLRKSQYPVKVPALVQ